MLLTTNVPVFNAEGYEVGYYHEVTVIPCWTQEYGWDVAQITVAGTIGTNKKHFPLTGEDFTHVRRWLLLSCYDVLAGVVEKEMSDS